ncbi:MAG: hypothetical protein GY794_10255 [bacterium]|nr:hypothetical protein [bacterium]
MRLELVRLSQDIAAVHRKIFVRQASLRSILTDLSGQPVSKRLVEQQLFMQRSAAEEAQLDRLREELKGLKYIRQEKTDEFGKIKSAREVMEKLREKAKQKHKKAMLKQEQKEMDENSRLAFASEIIDQQLSTVE